MSKQLAVLISFTLLVGFSNSAFAQDPHFSQFYGNPLYLNPALAGANRCPRIVMNYRNQWPGLDGTVYATYSASYDQHIEAAAGGIGLLAYHDVAGLGSLTTTQVSGIYSYLLKVNRDVNVKIGLQATWFQKGVDWSKLTFGDQIDRRKGFVYNTLETQKLESRDGWDFSAGAFAWYKTSFYGGFAVHHLTQPDEGLLTVSKLPLKFTVHAGGVIPIGQVGDRRQAKNKFSISPNILFMKQQDFSELNLGLYLKTSSFVAGMWYRNRDAVVVLIGIEEKNFNIGYSYDVTVSGLTNATAGSHEISLALKFACKEKSNRYDLVSCPSF